MGGRAAGVIKFLPINSRCFSMRNSYVQMDLISSNKKHHMFIPYPSVVWCVFTQNSTRKFPCSQRFAKAEETGKS